MQLEHAPSPNHVAAGGRPVELVKIEVTLPNFRAYHVSSKAEVEERDRWVGTKILKYGHRLADEG